MLSGGAVLPSRYRAERWAISESKRWRQRACQQQNALGDEPAARQPRTAGCDCERSRYAAAPDRRSVILIPK